MENHQKELYDHFKSVLGLPIHEADKKTKEVIKMENDLDALAYSND